MRSRRQNLCPTQGHLVLMISPTFKPQHGHDLPLLSGDLKASVVPCGIARAKLPLAGVASIVCSFIILRRGGSLLNGVGLVALERAELRRLPFWGDFRASFHCLTSSTASL